jgi:hypothetical protein
MVSSIKKTCSRRNDAESLSMYQHCISRKPNAVQIVYPQCSIHSKQTLLQNLVVYLVEGVSSTTSWFERSLSDLSREFVDHPLYGSTLIQ